MILQSELKQLMSQRAELSEKINNICLQRWQIFLTCLGYEGVRRVNVEACEFDNSGHVEKDYPIETSIACNKRAELITIEDFKNGCAALELDENQTRRAVGQFLLAEAFEEEDKSKFADAMRMLDKKPFDPEEKVERFEGWGEDGNSWGNCFAMWCEILGGFDPGHSCSVSLTNIDPFAGIAEVVVKLVESVIRIMGRSNIRPEFFAKLLLVGCATNCDDDDECDDEDCE